MSTPNNKTITELFALVNKVNEQIDANKDIMNTISEQINTLRQHSTADYCEIDRMRTCMARTEKEIQVMKNLFQIIKGEQQKELKKIRKLVTTNITIPELLSQELSELLDLTQDYFTTLLVDGKPPKKLFSKLDKDLATNLVLEMLRRRVQKRKHKIDLNP